MNYTKGEWTARKESKYGNWIISSGDGSGISSVSGEANAHLISAAPDMYEALKHTEIVLYNLKVSNLGELTQQQSLLELETKKALAKAEGKLNSN